MTLKTVSLLTIIPLTCSAEALPEIESFENGVPSCYQAKGGELTVTSDRFQDGTHALQWDCAAGDSLEIRSGALGNVGVSTGYGGYSHSALVMPIHLSHVSKGRLELQILAGDQVAGTVAIPLVHEGWQKLVYHYSWSSKITWQHPELRAKLDGFRLVAIDVSPSMRVLLDAVCYNSPRDFRDARSAVIEAWYPLKPDFSKQSAPTADDLTRMDKLQASILPEQNPKTPLAYWEKRLTAIRQQIQEKGFKYGMPIKGNLHLPTCFGLMNGIANDWCACADPKIREAIAIEFLTMNDWMQDQGLVVDGALGKANNYIGREYVDAISKMREPLAEHGTLDSAVAYIKWSYDYDARLFSNDGAAESMDYLHNEAFRLLRIALMHRDPIDRWHHVSRFRKVLTNQLVATVKPDGSLYHHGFHYFAYGGMGMNSISGALERLSNAGLPVEQRALDAVKLGVMRMRWYAGGNAVMLSLCGRHPSGTQMLNSSTFINLAKAYAPYRGGRWDRELVAAYLRFEPKQAAKAEFSGFLAESDPNGFVAMPFAGLGLQRRDHWLAAVKGYGKTLSAGESYADANRFGLYLSNGMLELHTHPQPLPTVHGSGMRPDEGWNWCALDGTTTIHSPLAKIANGNGTRSEYGSETFVGGLSHDGKNGAFAMVLRSPMQASVSRPAGAKGGPLEAKKSWFFFDNRIVCLGSGITMDGSEFPVRTTLFQKYLTDGHTQAVVGKETLEMHGDEAIVRDLNGPSVLRDPYGNLYRSNGNVHLTLSNQSSRDGYDKRDTRGRYATAWIDHGVNPRDAGYEYAVFVQASSQQTAALLSGAIPYQVMMRDNTAHVVADQATRTIGYAIFDAKAKLSSLKTRLQGVDQPCLVMIEERSGQLVVSVTDPDPRPAATTSHVVTIRLSGKLRAVGESPSGSKILSSGNETGISVALLHGESQTILLESVPAN